MKQFVFFLVAGGLAAIPLAAGTVNVTFVGANGNTDSAGYAISPYTADINNVQTTVYCNDFANDVTPGETWTANETNLASLEGLPANATTNTRYFGITQTLTTSTGTETYSGFQLYEMAAYLTTQFSANATDDGIIQDTIWDLFNPNSDNPGVNPPQASSSTYLFAAESNYSSIDPANFFILTNTNVQISGPGQVQEYMCDTPEPSTALLLGFGLAGLAAFTGWRRRLRHS
jgi:hypothetical protein